jgi:outer membrane protein
MRLRKGAVALAIAGVFSVGVARAEAQERTLTVEQVVQIVEQENPRVLQYLALAKGSRDLQRSTLGRMLPSISVNEQYQLWNSAYAIPFSLGPTMPPANFSVRDQNTNALSVTADQPLLGLIHRSHDHDAETSRAEASEADLETARAELKSSVETEYLRLFEARALEDIAKASERELAEQVTVTQARLNAGVLTTADLLRVQVAAANAKQQEIQAHSQGEVARANLLGAMGLPQSDTHTAFAEPTSLIARGRAATPSIADAEAQADLARPELKQRKATAEAARHVEDGRLFSLLPEVDVVGAYLRTDGSIFNPHNAGYLGVTASWAIFEWGASYYAERAAAAQAEAARRQAEAEQRQVGVEVATNLAETRASAAAVEVAEQTIASAEEAYRVMQALLKAGSATTTDLLDSEAALTQARLNLTRARYEQAIAQVALGRSLGVR